MIEYQYLSIYMIMGVIINELSLKCMQFLARLSGPKLSTQYV